MKIKVLFMQRKEDYKGQYGPEALAVVDEFIDDLNPEVFAFEVERQKLKYSSDEVAGFAVVEIDVDMNDIVDACCPTMKNIAGDITGSKSV